MKRFIRTRLSTLLSENAILDKILDRINQYGVESLTSLEKNWLDKHSKGIKDAESEEVLAIESGHTFRKDLSFGESITFIYDESEVYDDQIVHKGNSSFAGEEYFTEIYCTGDGMFSTFTLTNDDYVEFEEDIENELESFFKVVSDKINKTL